MKRVSGGVDIAKGVVWLGVHPWINPRRPARLERSRKKKRTRTCQGERVPQCTLSTNVPP